MGIEITDDGRIIVDPDTGQTSRKRVFAAGDNVTGPKNVVNAMAMGRRAAIAIDTFLGGGLRADQEALFTGNGLMHWQEGVACFQNKNRLVPKLTPVEKRVKSFVEVRSAFKVEEAIEESNRCLKCDARFCIPEVMLPPEEWVSFNQENIEAVPDIEGVLQLADQNKSILYIMGTDSIVSEIEDLMDDEHPLMEEVCFFKWEETSFFTTRQNELLQKYMQVNGELPQGNEEF